MVGLTQRFTTILDQGQMAGSLDGTRQLTLVFGAGTSLSAWADLAILGDEAAQHIYQLIVNHRSVVGTK
jgi:hypothetical protein